MKKLTIELVPKTCWYTNVRSNVTKHEWDLFRVECYTRAGKKCEICGETGKDQGYNHNVECHEIWDYNDKKKIQTLTGLIALCPRCHKCKHVGLAQINDEEELVLQQLMSVNDMTLWEAEDYIADAFQVWEERSKHNWDLDISYLDEYFEIDDDYDDLMNFISDN